MELIPFSLSLILSPQQTGRIEPNYPKVCGHQGNVLDIKWNPFIDNIIASCSEDTSVSRGVPPKEGGPAVGSSPLPPGGLPSGTPLSVLSCLFLFCLSVIVPASPGWGEG